MNTDMQGKTALITGGSTGIGAAFARHLAAQGARLILVARSEERLTRLRRELSTDVQILPCDLSVPGAAARIRAATGEVDLLVNNAGYATYGCFGDGELAEQSGQIQVNVTALVELSHAFLPMLVQRRGGIINVSSITAFQPMPQMAVYAATKAFVLSFSESLWAEYRDRGVTVLALCPGPTESQLFARIGTEVPGTAVKATAESVVREAMRAYHDRRSHVVSGWRNRLAVQIPRILPRSTVLRLLKRFSTPAPGRAAESRNSTSPIHSHSPSQSPSKEQP